MAGSTRTVELMSSGHMLRTLNRFSRQIIEDNKDDLEIILAGIEERGGYLARHLASILNREITAEVQCVPINPKQKGTSPTPAVSAEGSFLVILDDVIFSGRTLYHAFHMLMEQGEPGMIKLGALIDRGHRKFPVEAHYIGKYSPTKFGEHVTCHFSSDGSPRSVELHYNSD